MGKLENIVHLLSNHHQFGYTLLCVSQIEESGIFLFILQSNIH